MDNNKAVIITSLLIGLGLGILTERFVLGSQKSALDQDEFVKRTVYTLAGTVESVSGQQLNLTRNKKNLDLDVKDGVEITLVSQQIGPETIATSSPRRARQPEVTSKISLSDLRPGDQLMIKAELVKDRFQATTITATRRK